MGLGLHEQNRNGCRIMAHDGDTTLKLRQLFQTRCASMAAVFQSAAASFDTKYMSIGPLPLTSTLPRYSQGTVSLTR